MSHADTVPREGRRGIRMAADLPPRSRRIPEVVGSSLRRTPGRQPGRCQRAGIAATVAACCSIYSRAREIDDIKADAMLAVAFAAAGVVESIFVNSSGHSRPLTAVAAVALASPVVWRRRHTLGAVIGFMAVAA